MTKNLLCLVSNPLHGECMSDASKNCGLFALACEYQPFGIKPNYQP